MSVQEPRFDEGLKQQIVDDEHLKLLRIGYFVSAAVTALVSIFGLFYAFFGMFVLSAVRNAAQPGQAPPEFVGWIVGIFGLVIAGGALLFAAAKLYAAQCLQQRKSRVFCLVVAAITCLGIPEGTFLGICTFMVLNRPSVARRFASGN
jgi:hypothetical protein